MTNAKRNVLPQQVSATVRFIAAVGVCSVLAFAWIVAEHESHQAVQTATVALSRSPATPNQPVTQVAGRRVASARRS